MALWLKLSEDTSLPENPDATSRARLEQVFDAADPGSPWSRALTELGLRWPGGRVLRWIGGAAYVNGSAMASMISAGCVEVVRAHDGGYLYESRTRVRRLPALLKSQWKLEGRLASLLDDKTPLPVSDEEQLLESLLLGLALQALMLRLPRHEPRELAAWLAGSVRPPATIRKPVIQLQRIQARRTRLSPAWTRLFASASGQPELPAGPAWCWDDATLPPAAPSGTEPLPPAEERSSWSGLPVYPGRVSGRAWVVDLQAPSAPPAPPYVAVFAKARPQTVEHFVGAAGLVFGEGGVLSHACAVAREQSIPCVTAAGRDLLEAVRRHPRWITLDGSTGEVTLADEP